MKGEIITRGPEAFEATVKMAQATLEKSARPTAAKHIHEAQDGSVPASSA
jgi:hypothetical protein